MQASETKLEQIIEGTKQYLVPLFQRVYSWKKTEWGMLWNDIEELYSRDNPRPHFMGSIVTMPTMAVPEGVSKYLLIDGQQRLTTIFILLSAVRDKAKLSEEPELAAEIDNTILVNPYKKGSDYYKLQPTQSDRAPFHNIIHNQSLIDSNISDCYLFFEKKISRSKLDLHKIKKLICSNLSVVSVVLGNDDDPYVVFEGLNAKGRPLTQADLIRNYFFMRIHADEQEYVYSQYWQPMQNLLGESLTEFIRHYLTKSGVEIKQNEIYFEIKERIKKHDAIFYLKDLSVFAEYYAKLLNPDREVNEQVSKYLERLNRLEVATVYPFLLNCYHDWMQSLITEQEFISVLQILENFILRRFICNIQTRGLNRIFALLYSQISKDTNLTSDTFVGRLKLALQNRDYPKDTVFRDRLKDVQLYGGNRSEKAKLILESIEEYFNHKEQVPFKKLSIEHIMPQTLNDWWKEHLGEEWAIIHELLIHSLGNLTLTATEYNAAISNADFITKRTQFQKSHLELNKYFLNLESWRREDIEARAENLVDIALQIWSYFGDDLTQFHQPSDITGSRPKLLRVFGEEYSVKTWRDVLEITLSKIADLEPEKFEDIIQKYPHLVGWDEKNFRDTRKLKNGAFVEVNLSAKNIHAFCLKAIETAELSTEEWYLETVTS
ncbi:DUF262 domain-containing protein [Richelia sinica]|uniref:DUF262 domain-containing protein n=1 Tax=Richelia sinica TaxID=1357545 RepID=UPI0016876049|nr:DUF262 domain-containing protein [Richelia sinica]MBD2667254.1 DUF262 domain-containing protein [Richelia sinica FACHB-800]